MIDIHYAVYANQSSLIELAMVYLDLIKLNILYGIL